MATPTCSLRDSNQVSSTTTSLSMDSQPWGNELRDVQVLRFHKDEVAVSFDANGGQMDPFDIRTRLFQVSDGAVVVKRICIHRGSVASSWLLIPFRSRPNLWLASEDWKILQNPPRIKVNTTSLWHTTEFGSHSCSKKADLR